LQVSGHVNPRGILDFSRIQQHALIRFIIFMLIERNQHW